MSRRRERGYTMIEIVVTLAVFGVFLWIIVILTAEMRAQEKRYPVNFMSHPDSSSVVARLRRDIYDASYYPHGYPDSQPKYEQSEKVLLLYVATRGETVVWDFREKGEAHRRAFSAGAQTSDWVAHAVPNFSISSFDIAGGATATRIIATDAKGKLAIDQIFFPRAHS